MTWRCDQCEHNTQARLGPHWTLCSFDGTELPKGGTCRYDLDDMERDLERAKRVIQARRAAEAADQSGPVRQMKAGPRQRAHLRKER